MNPLWLWPIVGGVIAVGSLLLAITAHRFTRAVMVKHKKRDYYGSDYKIPADVHIPWILAQVGVVHGQLNHGYHGARTDYSYIAGIGALLGLTWPLALVGAVIGGIFWALGGLLSGAFLRRAMTKESMREELERTKIELRAALAENEAKVPDPFKGGKLVLDERQAG